VRASANWRCGARLRQHRTGDVAEAGANCVGALGTITQSLFATLSQNVTVRIGGALAQVLYQGAAPRIEQAVLQINAVASAGIALAARRRSR
jgi:uncharacterized protein (TIGR03437 family)